MYRPPPNVSPPPPIVKSVKKTAGYSMRKAHQQPVSFTWQQSLTDLPPVAGMSPQGVDLDPPPSLHRVMSMGTVEQKLQKSKQHQGPPPLRSVSPSGVPISQMTSTFSGASHAHIRAGLPKHNAAPVTGVMEVLSSRAPRAPLNEGKQWEFKILNNVTGGSDAPPAGDEEGSPKLERLPLPQRHHLQHKPNGLRGPDLGSTDVRKTTQQRTTNINKVKQQSSTRSVQQGTVRNASTTEHVGNIPMSANVDIPLLIEGNAMNAEVVAASTALLSLESCVARERRAKEELIASHKQVLIAFRQVVATFFSSVVGPSFALEGRNKMLHVSVAKCSVVVHTLVTTIQSYARHRLSQEIRELRRGGQHSSLASRLYLSNNKGSVPPSLCLDALSNSAVCESPGSHEDAESTRSSLHDVVFDNETIARLRQLYFDY